MTILGLCKGLKIKVSVIEPVGYLDMLRLISGAHIVLTDSGGLHEECCIAKIPCVTLRDNTERPETLLVGFNTLAGVNPASIIDAVRQMMNCNTDWPNPFGDGHASRKIFDIISRPKT